MLLVDQEGSTPSGPPTLSHEGEDNGIIYTNEEEKELYTFLSENKLIILYDKLKSFDLYVEHLKSINFDREEWDELCGANGLKILPHLKIRLKTAIRSLQNENVPDIIPIPIDDNDDDEDDIIPPPGVGGAVDPAPPHYYPPPKDIHPPPISSNIRKKDEVDHNNDREEEKREYDNERNDPGHINNHHFPSPKHVD
eukprot:168513_1